jgi:polyribonucleotide nucleotidyltransferase
MDGVLKEGDTVKVKLIGLDQKTGKFKLSRKVLMPTPEGAPGGGPRSPAGGEAQR